MAALWSDDISARTHTARIAENRLHPKKKTYGYRERDEVKRQEFALALTSKTHSMIVYVDEAGMDARDDYAYGWNERGQRFHAFKSGRRQGRVNMIAALCERQLMAPFTIELDCNRVVFETWLETCVAPSP